jgi:hypothetical protein
MLEFAKGKKVSDDYHLTLDTVEGHGEAIARIPNVQLRLPRNQG